MFGHSTDLSLEIQLSHFCWIQLLPSKRRHCSAKYQPSGIGRLQMALKINLDVLAAKI